jgi:two-component system chemotaxis response regulator CheB
MVARQLSISIQEPRPPHRHRGPEPMQNQMQMETRISEMDREAHYTDDRPGEPSAFSCPDCGGVLWEIADGEMARFRCRVGHAFSPETMLSAQGDKLEEALWSAMKTLEESARLAARLAASERTRGHEWLVKRFEDREAEARDRADLIRRVLASTESAVPIAAAASRRS